MWVWLCGQAKLLDHLRACKVIATPSINDDSAGSLLHVESGLKQVVPLILLHSLHLCAQHSLRNKAHMSPCVNSSYLFLYIIIITVYLVSSTIAREWATS